MNPKISVVVPVYNVEDYLIQCVESIRNQSFQDIEIILVNDGSQDRSGQICDGFLVKDSRIRVIHQENQGLSGARNSGLEIASGKYISFIDSDDWIEPEMFSTLFDYAITYDLDLIDCSISEGLSETHCNSIDSDSGHLQILNRTEAIIKVLKHTQFSACTKLFRHSSIESSRFRLNKTSEDVYFFIENIITMQNIGFCDIAFYNYRPNPKGITKSPYNLKRLEDIISACQFMKATIFQLMEKENDHNRMAIHQELENTIRTFMLNEFLHHYKMLNYNAHLDKNYSYRKRIRELIRENYYPNKIHGPYVTLANYLPMFIFHLIIRLNRLKHRVFKTNQFKTSSN